MTRDEFRGLPTSVALGYIYDAVPSLAHMAVPELPKSPRYDGKLFRKDGFCWMSEMLLADLTWWRNKKAESVQVGGKYADRDKKTVDILDKWIAWREACPTDAWSGTRGDDQVTAAPPTKYPAMHPFARRNNSPSQQQDEPDTGDDFPF